MTHRDEEQLLRSSDDVPLWPDGLDLLVAGVGRDPAVSAALRRTALFDARGRTVTVSPRLRRSLASRPLGPDSFYIVAMISRRASVGAGGGQSRSLLHAAF